MRRLSLREFQRTTDVELTTMERDFLADVADIDVRPLRGRTDTYDLTPGSTVGTVVMAGLQVDVHPKIELDRLLFLISYALDPVRWREQPVALDERDTLVTAMVHLWLSATQQALRRGLLQGYRQHEEALPTVRGQIRIQDQIRDRHGLMPPVEVAFDEFTIDIEENRLLAAAARIIARLALPERLRNRLSGVLALLADIPTAQYERRRLPEISYTRLNRHYRSAIELSKLVIAGSSLELGPSERTGQSFLVDMNKVFERFLYVALSEAMPATRLVHERPVHLDVARRVRMKPDLTWVLGADPVFVADAKYKALRTPDGRNPDIYQLLAYVVALGLPAGMLIHATGDGESGEHEVTDLGRRLHVEWLDISGEPEQILADVDRLASRVAELIRVIVPSYRFSGDSSPGLIAS